MKENKKICRVFEFHQRKEIKESCVPEFIKNENKIEGNGRKEKEGREEKGGEKKEI